MSKVTAEQAKAEVEEWLNKKKVSQGAREHHKDSIETLEEAIEEGTLVYNPETNEFTHKLLWPFEKGDITTLTYKARLNDIMIRPHLKGVELTDLDGRFAAVMAALTGQPRGIINALDSTDKRIVRSAANFFM